MQKGKSFSKLSKNEKIDYITRTYFSNPLSAKKIIQQYQNINEELQQLHDDFIENTLTNFYLPYGVAPHFVINDKNYTIPMVIEESSVVAAAAKSAKFWASRGGFKTRVIATEKIGQVHFMFSGNKKKLITFFKTIKPLFFLETKSITTNMQKRGGGILDIQIVDKTQELKNYYQLHATFDTKDSMGANFINSCLEQFAKTLQREALTYALFSEDEKNIEVIMSILSNYIPNCLVEAEVSCPVESLEENGIPNPKVFAEKFVNAVAIATIEPYRAVTHNKGIMNGVDAVVVATGNDFRAIEAGVHAYAARNGKYTSLSYANIIDGLFTFGLKIPMAIGTVGGLTSLHPMVKFSLEMLDKPDAKELMQIIAAAGLAQNFAAIKSLTTTGIQQGHMKMHLMNILNQYKATEEEKNKVITHFQTTTISHSAVIDYLDKLRLKG